MITDREWGLPPISQRCLTFESAAGLTMPLTIIAVSFIGYQVLGLGLARRFHRQVSFDLGDRLKTGQRSFTYAAIGWVAAGAVTLDGLSRWLAVEVGWRLGVGGGAGADVDWLLH